MEASHLNDRLNRLFDEWQSELREDRKFCRDGVFSENEWFETSPHVLFLLKETNDYAGDLRLLDLPAITWRCLGFWASALAETTVRSLPSFLSVQQRFGEGDAWKGPMRRASAMNLKKLTGDGQSDIAEISRHAIRDKTFIQEQLEIISPDVVVCCGSELFELCRKDIWTKQPSRVAFRWSEVGNAVWIDFFHPSARYPHFMSFYALAAIYQDYLRQS